jgi:hypothetical protein
MRGWMQYAARLDRYSALSTQLTLLSDGQLSELAGTAEPLAAGIGGSTSRLDIGGDQVFVKRIPLCDLERRPENLRSTANFFGLPVFYQYGLGSAGFGAWRELAVHTMTTNWVLAGQCPNFPLLYHWRVLPDLPPRPPGPAEQAELERMVAYWDGSPAVRERLQAIARASSSVVMFGEYFPQTLHDWLGQQLHRGGNAADAACLLAERDLQTAISFMNSRGLLHFDAHFNNILADGERLYFADFGLAMGAGFRLAADEARFFAAHRSFDRSYTAAHLVWWLEMARRAEQDRDPLISEYWEDRPSVSLPPAAEAIIERLTPLARISGDFLRRLREDKKTPYPASEIELACDQAGW